MRVRLSSIISKAPKRVCGRNSYPVLSITKDKGLVFQSDRFKKQIASVDQSKYLVVERGQLVLSIHLDEGVLGIQNVVDEGIVSPAYKIWNVNTDIVRARYLELLLKAPKSVAYYKSKAQSSVAGRCNISDKELLELEIEIPNFETQDKELCLIEKAAQIMDYRQQELIVLDDLIKARFVELFGHPDTNEKDWKMNVFGDVCTVRQGLQIPISRRLTEYEEDCYEYITVQYLHGGKEREYIKSPKSSVICTKDDILMTRTGNTGMVITDVAGVFHNNFFLIDFDRKKYEKVFLVNYLKLDTIQADIIRRAGTSTIPDLNHGEFYKIKVFEPPVALQKAFAALVAQVDKSKVAVQRALDEAQLLFDSLMQTYFG